ncbi:YdcF family protein [Streptomyces sp. NBC_00178]|uniref:YdcF family protein n=1 Tax=Streptomyces sp. NBC_00178 TaxID=2975672 RepID=UPI002E2E6211|nr:YdcF family protein [Streptomyces sp. NBC_00178]
MRRRTGLAAAGIAALVWGEWLNRRWSRALVGNSEGESEAVVVLGYRNPQTTANVINRWRVRAGVRSLTRDGARKARLIFSGGAVGSDAAEARLMADYATSVLGFDGTVLIEDRSRTTWENITNVIPMVEDVDRIKIVSQPAHALKARAYLRRQRPDLAARLVRGEDHRPGEWMLVKPLLALYGLRTLRGLTADERKVSRAPRRGP